jgi:hypothetical protein
LLVTAHHLVADDVAQLWIVHEVLAAYTQGATYRAPGDSFGEFVDRQRSYLATPRARAAEAHWRGELADVGSSAPLGELPRKAADRHGGAHIVRTLSTRATRFVYLLSVFQVVLYQFSGTTDFLVWYPVSQRSSLRYATSLGYFVNLLPLRVSIDPAAPFAEVVRRTQSRVRRAMMHREYPTALMPGLAADRFDRRRRSLISVVFGTNAERSGDPMFELFQPDRRVRVGGLTVSRFDVREQQSHFDVNVVVTRQAATMQVTLRYNASVLDEATASRLAGDFESLLTAAIEGRMPSRLGALRSGARPSRG